MRSTITLGMARLLEGVGIPKTVEPQSVVHIGQTSDQRWAMTPLVMSSSIAMIQFKEIR